MDLVNESIIWFSSSHFTHLSSPPTDSDWNSCHLMVLRKQTTHRSLLSSESHFSSNCEQRIIRSCTTGGAIDTKWSHIFIISKWIIKYVALWRISAVFICKFTEYRNRFPWYCVHPWTSKTWFSLLQLMAMQGNLSAPQPDNSCEAATTVTLETSYVWNCVWK